MWYYHVDLVCDGDQRVDVVAAVKLSSTYMLVSPDAPRFQEEMYTLNFTSDVGCFQSKATTDHVSE